MCQDLNRVELSSPTSGPSFQPAAKGLGVSIYGGQTAVVPAGETFSYTINVTNDSNETATGVMLVTKLDDSSTFVSASSSRGQCSQSGVEVACPLGSLAGGASASVSITLIAATSGLVAADSITLSAASGELSADQSSVHLTTIVYGSTTPASGGLSVSLSDEVDPVVPGETLTYIVTVSPGTTGSTSSEGRISFRFLLPRFLYRRRWRRCLFPGHIGSRSQCDSLLWGNRVFRVEYRHQRRHSFGFDRWRR